MATTMPMAMATTMAISMATTVAMAMAMVMDCTCCSLDTVMLLFTELGLPDTF